MTKLNIKVIRTPKGHAEVAGEGVEYTWGGSKNTYRLFPRNKKCNKETFMASVREVLSRDHLDVVKIRKYARRARSYILAYYGLDHDLGRDSALCAELEGENTLPKIEKLQRRFRTHRCALDFDYSFVTKS